MQVLASTDDERETVKIDEKKQVLGEDARRPQFIGTHVAGANGSALEYDMCKAVLESLASLRPIDLSSLSSSLFSLLNLSCRLE